MKVLIVCSFNNGKINAFIEEQANELKKSGLIVDYFLINKKGMFGYFLNLFPFYRKIYQFKPDLIHAHYGLSGLFSNLQPFFPVITTYHGSDIHQKSNIAKSKICFKLSKKNIFVGKDQVKLMDVDQNYYIIPCGVDMNLFTMKDKNDSKRKLNFNLEKKYILFSSSFDNKIKNYPLAANAMSLLKSDDIELIELKGHSREKVVALMNACDLVLMTSVNEGSPQFIKEAMACSTPIVTTDVGDVKIILGETQGTFICKSTPENIAVGIKNALEFAVDHVKTNGRQRIIDLKLDNKCIAKQLIEIYKNVLNSNNVNNH